MYVIYLIASLLLVTGIIIFAKFFSAIKQWILARKICATISEVDDETWNDGRIRFKYEFQINGKLYAIWSPWYETFNPFMCLFPHKNVGKRVNIRINTRNLKIVYPLSYSFLLLLIGCAILMCGIIIIICF